MKRFGVVLVCVVWLLMLLPFSAFADFNAELFKTKDYEVEIDDFENTTSIFWSKVRSTSNRKIDMTFAITNTGGVDYYFIIWYFSYPSSLGSVDKILFLVDGSNYTFSSVANSSSSDMAWLMFSNEGMKLFEHMKTADDIKVRLSGKNSNEDFTIPDSALQSLLDSYDLFIQAGGAEGDRSGIDLKQPMEIE